MNYNYDINEYIKQAKENRNQEKDINSELSDMIADVALCKALLDSIDFEENKKEQARLYEQTRKISIL